MKDTPTYVWKYCQKALLQEPDLHLMIEEVQPHPRFTKTCYRIEGGCADEQSSQMVGD